MKAVLLLSFFLVAGCTEYRWSKQGASEHDFELAKSECEVEGLRLMPPNNIITSAHSDVLKAKSNGNKNNKLGFDIKVEDINEHNRNIFVKDCMYRKGWSRVEVKI